ncbi:MAG: glycosyltransferase family protein [Sterolibacterium sp.]|nr:glycosyltransferase family protein [Sterolibacterium sp.]
MPRTIATIEARMTSSRLPGKVLLPAGGKPLLAHLVHRLRAVPSLDAIVLATTAKPTDDPLAAFAAEQGIACFRGSEDDVMERVIGAAASVGAETVVEITGDCPLIDPQIVEQVIRLFLNNDCAYASNAHIRGYPDGMDVQVFRLESLRRSAAMTSDPTEHEHVTLHIRRHPELFRPIHLLPPHELDWPDLGLTLDEPADYRLIKTLVEYFGAENPLFSCREIIALLRSRPDLVAINSDVKRKGDA